MAQLICNKTKLIKLCREHGYHPQTRDAQFAKAFRKRTWWLEWGEDGVYYRASFFVEAGKVVLGVSRQWLDEQSGSEKSDWHCSNVTMAQLGRLQLIQKEG